MQTPQIVKVFLGSSITELKDERLELSALSEDINNIFSHDEIVVRIVRCENFHAGNVGKNDQEYIDQKLRGCDISLFVFKSKAGEWTRHEYAVARELQKEKKHRIFVCFLSDPNKKKGPGLNAFKKQLKTDGVFWRDCNSPSEVKYEFFAGILTHLNITVDGHAPGDEAEAKDADERFEQFEQGEAQQQQLRQQLHQDIDDLLAQIPAILDDKDQRISARIVEVMGLYQKADRWASKTGYDKEKNSDMLLVYARFLYDCGMYYDAETVYLRQIHLAEDLYGKEHKNTAVSYNNIGLVYDYQGNYLKALDYLKKALTIYEKVLGKDHPNTATSYNNIGTVYDDQGKYPEALEYHEKALAIYEKALGKDHPDTATGYNNIGEVYRKRGDYPKALEYYEKALVIREKVLGKDHPYTATTYNNIGLVYHHQHNYTKALEYLKKALAIDEKVLGKDHPGTATDYNNIGSMYYQLEKYPKALEYLENALEIRKAKLGEDHPDTIATQGWIDDTKAAMRE